MQQTEKLIYCIALKILITHFVSKKMQNQNQWMCFSNSLWFQFSCWLQKLAPIQPQTALVRSHTYARRSGQCSSLFIWGMSASTSPLLYLCQLPELLTEHKALCKGMISIKQFKSVSRLFKNKYFLHLSIILLCICVQTICWKKSVVAAWTSLRQNISLYVSDLLWKHTVGT